MLPVSESQPTRWSTPTTDLFLRHLSATTTTTTDGIHARSHVSTLRGHNKSFHLYHATWYA
jgi:hypothetical protein